jgi:Heterokaryon incompatibility protein (HET)
METMGTMDTPYDHELTKKFSTITSSVFKGILPVVKPLVNNIREFRGKPLSIWIDTLCVPLNSEKHRRVAIEQMEGVYAQSAFTLVIDSELETLKHNECTAQDILVRVGLSGWMRRAWTFQEGVMSNRRVRPLFADGIFPLPLGPRDINKTVDER